VKIKDFRENQFFFVGCGAEAQSRKSKLELLSLYCLMAFRNSRSSDIQRPRYMLSNLHADSTTNRPRSAASAAGEADRNANRILFCLRIPIASKWADLEHR
jgi:hypothetical protein